MHWPELFWATVGRDSASRMLLVLAKLVRSTKLVLAEAEEILRLLWLAADNVGTFSKLRTEPGMVIGIARPQGTRLADDV